jgi:hypothetical protein
VDEGPGGIPHVARLIQLRIEHQRDRQKNGTPQWNDEEMPSLSSSACIQEKIKNAQQSWTVIENTSSSGFRSILSLSSAFITKFDL